MPSRQPLERYADPARPKSRYLWVTVKIRRTMRDGSTYISDRIIARAERDVLGDYELYPVEGDIRLAKGKMIAIRGWDYEAE